MLFLRRKESAIGHLEGYSADRPRYLDKDRAIGLQRNVSFDSGGQAFGPLSCLASALGKQVSKSRSGMSSSSFRSGKESRSFKGR